MIKHIVMWKMDSSYSAAEKEEFLNAFREKLLGLKGKIPELLEIAVHGNAQGAAGSNYDLLLDTSFNSLADLNSYAVHPEHLKVVEFSKSHKKERACVDYVVD